MGHPLVQLNCSDMGTDYRISWICDNCNKQFMRSKQPNFLHCRVCQMDFCDACKPVADPLMLTATMSIEPASGDIRVYITNLAGSPLDEGTFALEAAICELEARICTK